MFMYVGVERLFVRPLFKWSFLSSHRSACPGDQWWAVQEPRQYVFKGGGGGGAGRSGGKGQAAGGSRAAEVGPVGRQRGHKPRPGQRGGMARTRQGGRRKQGGVRCVAAGKPARVRQPRRLAEM